MTAWYRRLYATLALVLLAHVGQFVQGPLGRVRDRVVRALVESSTKNGMAILHELRRREALPPYRGSVFEGKLFVPALQALRDASQLVIAATGGRHTEALRARFARDNVLIEDWIDFGLLLPRADVFVTNGGYGSVMQALLAGVPIVAAGRLEGKNDVNARLAYNGLAIDLGTERPSARRIARSVERISADDRYRHNVARVRAELESDHPFDLIEQTLLEDARAWAAAM